MAYWLLKTEPDLFSIDDLQQQRRASWDGVRNPMACANLRSTSPGDLAFFYHSSCAVPGVAGVCEIVREAYPDHTAWDPASRYYDPKSSPDNPRWWMPDVAFVEKFDEVVPLSHMRGMPELQAMSVLRFSRLSVHPVALEHWEIVCSLGRGGAHRSGTMPGEATTKARSPRRRSAGKMGT